MHIVERIFSKIQYDAVHAVYDNESYDIGPVQIWCSLFLWTQFITDSKNS